MTRRFIDDIKNEINTLMADNASGDFTLAMDRSIRFDMLDSTVQEEATILSNHVESLGYPVTGSYALLSSVYNETIGGDGTFLIVNESAGQITTTVTPGFTYFGLVALSIQGPNNADYLFTISENGVQIGYQAAVTSTGGTNRLSMSFPLEVNAAPASASYGVSIMSPNGAATVDILDINFRLAVLPTFNP
jgi:hypothetical protein